LPQDECLEGIRAVGDLAARLFLLDDPETLQTETVERTTRILRCTSGMICLLGEDGGAMTRGPAVGKAKDLVPADLLAVGPVAEVVFKERRPLVLNDPELTLGRRFRGWTGMAIVPLAGSERLVGVLLVGERLDGGGFTDQDEALLATIGTLAAGALEIRLAFTQFRDRMNHRIAQATRELAHASHELHRVKAFNEELFQSVPIGIIVFDREFGVTFRNAAAERLWPQDRSVLAAARRTDLASRDPDWEIGLADVVNMQHLWRAEDVTFARPGAEPVRMNLAASPLVTAGRSVVGGVLIVEDVTQRLQMERRLAASERLAGVGRLAANVAHELNNPLDGIMRLVNLARRTAEPAGDERIARYLAEANKGLMRMVMIVRDLLEYARSTTRVEEPIALRDILAEAAGGAASAAEKAGVRIDVACDPDLPALRSGSLYQVVLNLVKNAVEAMPGGGEVAVRARCEADALLIEVADSGPGIPDEHLPRIFEPFYTTKGQGQGTGLGLAISKDLVEKHGGTIAAANRPGGGAVFTVRIPIASGGRPDGWRSGSPGA
jgi:signal transduction histidine kinase